MKAIMGIVALTVIPITAILSLLSSYIMKGYGTSFVSGKQILIISVVTAALIVVMGPVGQFLAASGRMWVGFFMNLGWGISPLLGSYLMV